MNSVYQEIVGNANLVVCVGELGRNWQAMHFCNDFASWLALAKTNFDQVYQNKGSNWEDAIRWLVLCVAQCIAKRLEFNQTFLYEQALCKTTSLEH